MQISVRGHGIKVTAPLRDYAQKKIGKIEHYFERIKRVEIQLEFRKVKDPSKSHAAEVTVWATHKSFRAVEKSADMYSSIDLVFAKLEHQIVKFKEILVKKNRRIASKTKHSATTIAEIENNASKSSSPIIVAVKRFAAKPMTPEEAVEQINLSGHEFYMFRNSASEEVNVVYRRKSGNFGLIEPDL